MNEEKLRRLLSEYFSNTISNTDCIELLSYINRHPDDLNNVLDDLDIDASEGPEFFRADADQIYQRIISDRRLIEMESSQKFSVLSIIGSRKFSALSIISKPWLSAAAVLVISATIVLLKMSQPVASHKNRASVANNKINIVPGSNQATLTLANKNVIQLGNLGNGAVVTSGSLHIHKVKDGELVYREGDSAEPGKTAEIATNTLTTPRGGQYQVVLADGTRVWLNSASSLSYPDKFNGKTREVTLSGEAYFEVAKNKDQPFLVNIDNVSVRVLGTHFNVSAYRDDDDVKTTLLEGSVQMSKKGELALLKPGEQGRVMNDGSKISVSQTNIEQAVAWKNGYFSFNDENINDIMKKISRWYNVDVEYKGQLRNQQFGGIYSRSKGIVQLLDNLQKIGNVHFQIQERRVIVMN